MTSTRKLALLDSIARVGAQCAGTVVASESHGGDAADGRDHGVVTELNAAADAVFMPVREVLGRLGVATGAAAAAQRR